MKPRKTLSIYVLLVGVMGLSIVGGILAFQIFSAATKNQATVEQTAATKPIEGSIRREVIDNLIKRTVITESSLAAVDLVTPVVTPTTTQSEVATISGTLGQ